MKRIFLIILLFLLFFLSSPTLIRANGEGLVPCGNPGEPPCQFCDFFEMFDRIIDFILFRIVPPLAALMIAIGAFMYIFAYAGVAEGGPEMISRAKRLFTAVAIGLLIIYGAWLIVNTFFMMIGVNEFNKFKTLPQNWWKIECETTAPGPASGSGPVPGSGSPGVSPGPAPAFPTTAAATTSVRREGDELYVDVVVSNTSDETRNYWVELKTGDGKKITGAKQWKEQELSPGETSVFKVSTWGPGADIDTLGTHYTVEVWDVTNEGNNVMVFQQVKEIPK